MQTVATAELQDIRPFAIWAAYFGAIAIIWVVSRLITGFALRRTSADGVTIALGSVYGNIVMLGIPLCVAVLGEESVGPMAVILAVNTPVLWLLATLELTVAERRRETSLTQVVYDVCIELVRNPIVIGIVMGGLIRLSGLGFHEVADRTLSLLAQAATPAALVALGASLAKFRLRGQVPTLLTMSFLKLIAMPIVAAWLALQVFQLPPVAAGVVILFSTAPGAMSFCLGRYNRVVNSAAGCIALGTALSVLTTTAIVAKLLSDDIESTIPFLLGIIGSAFLCSLLFLFDFFADIRRRALRDNETYDDKCNVKRLRVRFGNPRLPSEVKCADPTDGDRRPKFSSWLHCVLPSYRPSIANGRKGKCFSTGSAA